MTQPDPNQFARLVFHHLVKPRVEIAEIRFRMEELYEDRFGQVPEADRLASQQKKVEEFEALYKASLSEAGLLPSTQNESPPESPPSVPDDAPNGGV